MMTWPSRTIESVIVAGLLISAGHALRLADRIEQSLEGRSTYQGGWPLAAASCPAEASVVCHADGGINPTCCPNGQTCFGTTTPYCCPSAIDCASEVNSRPVCADSSWDMYGQNDGSTFFCCQSGQLAVDPPTGQTGICEGAGRADSVSLQATMVAQIGVPAYRRAITSSTTFSTTSAKTTSTTKSASATKTLFSSSASGTSSIGNSTVTAAIGLTLGAIVGIAVGGCLLMLALLCLCIWCCCCRSRRHPVVYAAQQASNTTAQPPPQQQMYTAPPTSQQMYTTSPTPQQMYTAPPTPQQMYTTSPTPQQMYSPMPPTYHSAQYDPNMQRGISPGTEFKAVSPHVTQTPVEERPTTFGRSEM